MKTALFTNFTDQEFIGYWDGKPKKFEAGKSIYMPEYLAKHFAKHLVNKELTRKNEDGTPKYLHGEEFTSPKNPEQVPLFMELFEKAYTPDLDDEYDEKIDEVDTMIDVSNKNRQKEVGNLIVTPPDDDEDFEESANRENNATVESSDDQ